MPATNAALKTFDVSPDPSSGRSDQTLRTDCALAIRLVRDFFEHATPDTDEAQLTELLNRAESAVARVARERAASCADVASKYALQSALRPYRALTSDLMAAVGASIKIDLAALEAEKTSVQTSTSAGTWFGRVLSSRWSRFEAPQRERSYEHAS